MNNVTHYPTAILRTFADEPLLLEGWSRRIEGIAIRGERAVQIAIYARAERRTRIVLFAGNVPAVEHAIARAVGGFCGVAGRIEKERFVLQLETSSSLDGPILYLKRLENEVRKSTTLEAAGIRALQDAFRWMVSK